MAKETSYMVKAGTCYEKCTKAPVAFPVPDMAMKNKVFDQLTVAEQMSIEDMMKPYGVSFEAWNKCDNVNCSTIGKIALIKPPKAAVLAYLAGGPKPARVAGFWWLNYPDKSAKYLTVEMPITAMSVPTTAKTLPWNRRPFIYWEQIALQKRNEMLDPLKPIFEPLLKSVIPSESMKEMLEAKGENFSTRIGWSGGARLAHGSTLDVHKFYGRMDIRCNAGVSYFKDGPMQFTPVYDYTTDTLTITDIQICPGKGNPLFQSVDEVLAASAAGTLKLCTIDGEWYGDTMASMDPKGPYYLPDDMASRIGPVASLPEGPRYAVNGRTIAWMGWDFHADIHALTGMQISNLRFKGERLAYEIYAADFTAIYSGASTRKDIFYSDGGYEMGNCATALHAGLQCPLEGTTMLYSLGYTRSYVWGNALKPEDNEPTMCVFEGPENEALFQHTKAFYEGLPATSLYVRSVLTVGNYDYTQTFKVSEDGSFHWTKELSGYAVGAYVDPTDASTEKMSELFGSMISKSSIGALHTHSAVTKVDLDIAGINNYFKVKKPGYGKISDLLATTGIDQTGIGYQAPSSFYFSSDKVTNEGMWDNDGDSTWTPPAACLRATTGDKYVVYSDEKTRAGNNRGFEIQAPGSPPQLLPEGDAYLHLQNFTKCDIAVTKYNTADMWAVPPEVFGNFYPNPAPAGHDISHFFDGESLENVDLVFYVHNTKHHFVRTEDVPVPTTMGKAISFEPYNFNVDDVGTFKHLPKKMYRYDQPNQKRTGIPVADCAA